MYATNYFETQVLNTFNNTTFVAPSELYVALFLSNPTETGIAGNEVNYTGYTRVKVTFTSPYAESGGIGIKNNTDLLWNKSPADVGQARYIGIYDSQAIGSGNMLLYGELTIPLDIKANQQPSIYTGDILYYATGNFSTYFKTKIMNTLRSENLQGFSPYIALFDGDPEGSGAELTGGAYARVKIDFSSPSEQTGGQMLIQNTSALRFPSPTSVWGNWVYDGLKDGETSGNLILKSKNPVPEVIQKNYVPSIEVGEYKIMIN